MSVSAVPDAGASLEEARAWRLGAARPGLRSIEGFASRVASEPETWSISLLVDGAHCAACIRRIEAGLSVLPGVQAVYLNLSLRRLSLTWQGGRELADDAARLIADLGYRAVPFDGEKIAALDRERGKSLITALAVTAFASTNVMMLSFAVWSGEGGGMEEATRGFFQVLSALVGCPAILFGAWTFFRSAARALLAGTTNIDVPISAAILLSMGLSLVETVRGGTHVYFESAIGLVFVLLLGRLLEHRVRAKARSAVEHVLSLRCYGAEVRQADGTYRLLPTEAIAAGDVVLVPEGERSSVDGIVIEGRSSLDVSHVTGEARLCLVEPGGRVLAGSLNRGDALLVRAETAFEGSTLADIARLIDAADARRGRYRSISDRVAAAWTIVIHGLALLTFFGWLSVGGASALDAGVIAVSVLIIACPCAVGLAVPAVETVAVGALMKCGILVRSGDALERLADIDHVVFDKTGTLTNVGAVIETDACEDAIALASAMAAASTHPLSRAIRAQWSGPAPASGVEHVDGRGLRLMTEQGEVRLGSGEFCGVSPGAAMGDVWLARPGHAAVRFVIGEALRSDARQTLQHFVTQGVSARLLSGDADQAVARVANALGIGWLHSGAVPTEKVHVLEGLRARGLHVLMVGDGLNDAPALAAAYMSASFSHGSAASQSAADIVLPEHRLWAVVEAHVTARRAMRLVRENLGLAFLYNALLVPVAMSGLVTPLGAALAMSASSLTVTLNALRAGVPREVMR